VVPIIPRPEAHDLPRRLKTLATAGKPWLHDADSQVEQDHHRCDRRRIGRPAASGMF
jgi:23S rRNA (adenine2030-N6)-methyltransferase